VGELGRFGVGTGPEGGLGEEGALPRPGLIDARIVFRFAKFSSEGET